MQPYDHFGQLSQEKEADDAQMQPAEGVSSRKVGPPCFMEKHLNSFNAGTLTHANFIILASKIESRMKTLQSPRVDEASGRLPMLRSIFDITERNESSEITSKTGLAALGMPGSGHCVSNRSSNILSCVGGGN